MMPTPACSFISTFTGTYTITQYTDPLTVFSLGVSSESPTPPCFRKLAAYVRVSAVPELSQSQGRLENVTQFVSFSKLCHLVATF